MSKPTKGKEEAPAPAPAPGVDVEREKLRAEEMGTAAGTASLLNTADLLTQTRNPTLADSLRKQALSKAGEAAKQAVGKAKLDTYVKEKIYKSVFQNLSEKYVETCSLGSPADAPEAGPSTPADAPEAGPSTPAGDQ